MNLTGGLEPLRNTFLLTFLRGIRWAGRIIVGILCSNGGFEDYRLKLVENEGQFRGTLTAQPKMTDAA
jgi:hypothetical protein